MAIVYPDTDAKCARGHLLRKEGQYESKSGKRQCRRCRIDDAQRCAIVNHHGRATGSRSRKLSLPAGVWPIATPTARVHRVWWFIDRERKKQKMSVRKLAKLSGLDKSTLYLSLQGVRSSTLLSTEAVLNALGHMLKPVKKTR